MIRVGVIRGGTGPKYQTSLDTGAFVLKHLPREEFEPVDIFVDRDGAWHMAGRPVSPDRLARNVDVVWNALHGHYGEDGKLARFLESVQLPYVGTPPLPAAVAMHERLLNERLGAHGFPVRKGMYVEEWADISAEDAAQLAAAKLSPPWIVVPVMRGVTEGEYRAKTRPELTALLAELRAAGLPVFVEEATLGREVSVVTVPGFRKEKLYTFIPLGADGRRATNARAPEHAALQQLAKKAHEVLNLGHYSRVHMVLTPKGKIVIRSVDTVPDLSKESPVHAMLASTGATFAELARHLIGLAKER